MPRPLGAEERALWEKVVASVRPLHPQRHAPSAKPPSPPELLPAAPPVARRTPVVSKESRARAAPGTSLDSGWDRRLARGLVHPEIIVDLHGHNLATAYHLLDLKLEQAVAMGARMMLLITGKAPAGEWRPANRGAIRAAVGDWMAASRHAGDIAAVRNAHPRHGGAGALYIILRRRRPR
jgi:DNA-nicking Smr family endonuclease